MNEKSLPPRGKNINLIPTEMAVPARAVKLTKTLNKISVVGAIILIVIIIISGGLFFYFSSRERQSAQNVENLKNRISDLDQSEQKLILAKDRLAKIAVVHKAKSANSEILKYQQFSDIMVDSPDSRVMEANLNSSGAEVTILVRNSTNLTQILSPLSALVDYKRIILSSLGYNPSTGFIANLLLESD